MQIIKQLLSEKTNKVLELTEKLQLAQDTITALEERQASFIPEESLSMQKQISEVRGIESFDHLSEDMKPLSSYDGDQ